VKRAALLLAVAAAVLLSACGGEDAATTQARVYFLQDGGVENDKVWPVAREIAVDASEADEVLAALVAGPSAAEEDLGLTTAIPESATVSVSASGELSVGGLGEPFDLGLAQIVYTLTQFPGARISYDGESVNRSDFEQFTPSVLVESPLPFEEVTSPITAVGTANTFEANFQYELLDADGEIVDENFVTATSGTGTRGTFEFTTADFDDVAALVVFESSAEDGSRIHEVEIPLDPAP
jgi:germination protein M